MKNAIKFLLKIKITLILIVIQFGIGFYLINTSEIISTETIEKKNNIERVLDFKNSYLLSVATYNDELNPAENFPKISKTYEALDKMKKEGIIKNHYLYYGGGLNPIADSNAKKMPIKFNNINTPELFKYAAEINICQNFYNKYDLNITDGRGFNEEDFKVKGLRGNIPVIIGQDYKSFVKIGDTFSTKVPDMTTNNNEAFLDVTYEVIGFYKHFDMPILGDPNGTMISSMYYSDAFMIIPVVNDILWLGYQTMIAQYGIWVETDSKEKLKMVEKNLNEILAEDKFSLNKYYAGDEFDIVYENLLDRANNSIILGIALIILSVIGVSAIMVGKITSRKKEFGIKIASGATIRDIIIEVIFENTIICFLSMCSSLIIVAAKYQNYLTIESVIKNFIITFIIIIVVNILPIIKIKNLMITDLMKR